MGVKCPPPWIRQWLRLDQRAVAGVTDGLESPCRRRNDSGRAAVRVGEPGGIASGDGTSSLMGCCYGTAEVASSVRTDSVIAQFAS